MDQDGELEVVYVNKDTGNVRYIDGVGGANTIENVSDADDTNVDGSQAVCSSVYFIS